MPSKLFLLKEAGNGDPYEHPAKSKESYVTLPASFWTRGVDHSSLGSRSSNSADPSRPVAAAGNPLWLSPRLAKELYSLSSETWARGSSELARHGLARTVVRPVRSSAFGVIRRRKVYELDETRLSFLP